jgi:hypothetical protein
MNNVKELSQQLSDAAKTEYGYSLHMASFGIIVAAPFYLIMFLGGLIHPLIRIAKSSQEEIKKINVVYSMAIGAFLAGFNGYYGQATSISQFTYLIWIGIAIALSENRQLLEHKY